MTTRAYSYICSPLPDTAEELLWKVNLFSDLKIVLPPSSLGGAEKLKNLKVPTVTPLCGENSRVAPSLLTQFHQY